MSALEPEFSGQDFSLLRDKNRFVLPPKFRKQLKIANHGSEESESRVLLLKHDRWECLIGFGESRLRSANKRLDREEQLAAKAGREFDRDKRALDLNTYEDAPFDSSGRFTLPDGLAVVAGIKDQIFYQGGGEFFTLWAPEELYKMGDDWRAAKTFCQRLAERELAKARKK
ncbi:MAG: division/cell wall cluster transcriptional repressor MraZ [Sphingomonadaceae bacterium]